MFWICVTAFSPSAEGNGLSTDTLTYRSAFEKQVFDSLKQNTNINDERLFMMYDSDSLEFRLAQKRLNKFYEEVLTTKLRGRDDKARSKIIFDEVHQYFLVKYVDTVSFSSIFKDGKYNCVSGSALYALVLSHYNIPYEIREVPTHVYVIAYPRTLNVLLETTNPRGYFAPTEKTIELRMSSLVQAGYVSKEYVDEVGAKKAHDEFFYTREAINIQNLAALQYWNGSIRDRVRNSSKSALQKIEKADVLFPSKKNEYFKSELLNNILAEANFDNIEDVKFLIRYTNLKDTNPVRDQAAGAFASLIKTNLIQKSNERLVRDAYNLLMTELKNQDLQREITRLYNSEFAQYHLMKNQLNEGFVYANAEYAVNPNDVLIQSMIAHIVMGKLGLVAASTTGIKTANEYVAKYPFLKSNSNLTAFYIAGYANQAFVNFVADRGKEGHRYLQLMENAIAAASKDVPKNETIIGYAYAEAGAHYFRQADYTNSLKWMERGLKYAPDHPEIKVRIQITKDEIKARGGKKP